ncbi:hypothetical protein CDL15_Pgr021065 [Punica granatum]|uniref:Uncharacterized protein n=1 Tax=Punica granatum TaxID=22663 RepID=A0A218WS56_PUNGR|nr:hypothetical protein CDL15_Pgr021065 [Punica granatum]
MRNEHFPPCLYTWLSFINRDRRRRSGIRPFRSREQYRQTPRRLKAPPKPPCAQSYTPSGRSEIDFVASLLTLVQKSRTTRSDRGPRPRDSPPERYVRPNTGKGAPSSPFLGLADAVVFCLRSDLRHSRLATEHKGMSAYVYVPFSFVIATGVAPLPDSSTCQDDGRESN